MEEPAGVTVRPELTKEAVVTISAGIGTEGSVVNGLFFLVSFCFDLFTLIF